VSHSLTLPAVLDASRFRNIGPTRGGRVVAVAGHASLPATYYFGAVAGGIWKTEDAGTTWRCISDGQLKTASVGALCVADSQPNVLYAGMGETTIRTDVTHGDGVYKSNDGGRTWKHLGLADTRHIGRVRVHPKNPDIVYVAALGHAFGPNPERGVFRSHNGGVTWEKVLYKSDKAGAVDLCLDPQNPDVVYASLWQTYRNFWELSSGGPDSGLWRSRDGGDTWEELSLKPGFPQTLKGKIGVAASPVKAGRVWAIVEAKDASGLYRSEDFGDTWQLVTDSGDLLCRPWYYMHIFADPQDADTVYVLNLDMHKSTDGGKTFTSIPTPHGDNHDLWIDPTNNQRMIEGNDGGACISFNGGDSFSTIYNQLTAQFYHLDVDDAFPYGVYGTQQDNSSIRVPSDTIEGGIPWSACEIVGTGESGYVAVKPDDPSIVFVGAVGSAPGGQGALQRCDRKSGHIQMVNVWAEDVHGRGVGEAKYRFPWTYPILFSPHDPNVLYVCGNLVFRSTDQGHSWQPISPDLTRADMSKLGPSGGPITLDTSGAEHYATIYTFRESPHQPGVFWAGSDDGLVHLSRDGGASWQNITPPDLPEWSYIRTLEPSPFDPATCYLAATRYKLDDPAPYLYKTADYGVSWQSITTGLPADDFLRVVRCDPNRQGVLYAGSELGLYVSVDDGASWARWTANLPVAPIYDMKIKGTDLILATHGRGFWIGEDLPLLYQWLSRQDSSQDSGHDSSHDSTGSGLRLFAPRRVYRVLPDLFADWVPAEGRVYGMLGSTYVAEKSATGQVKRAYLDAGEGARRGAVIHYHLDAEPPADAAVKLEILDARGNVLRTYGRKPAGYDKLDDAQKALDPGPWLPLATGFNTFVWNLRLEGATKVPGNKTAGEAAEGPYVLPGSYAVRITIGAAVQTEPFEVVNDPRVTTSLADLAEQQNLLLAVRDKVSAVHSAIIRLRTVREQIAAWKKRLGEHGAAQEACDKVLGELAAIEDVLYLPGDHKMTYSLIVRPRLNQALASVIPVIASADAKPTASLRELVDHYFAQIDAQLARLDGVLADDVAQLNALIGRAALPPIAV
jgi:photosystem II stability/assembly factor-like uncharacterized protein